MVQLQIDEVYPKGKIYPMVVNFQNGYVTNAFKRKRCSLLQHDETSRRSLVTEINDIIYAGEEDTNDTGKTFVLARNKKTGKTRLIEVGKVNLKPILQSDLDTTQLLETSNLELSRKFGSKKQKQKMEQREKLKVNTETVSQQMQNVTETISEDKLDLSLYNKSDSDDFYIPSIDRTADKVENVYSFSSILTEEQYDKVYSELEDHDFISKLSPIIKNILANKKETPKKQTVLAIYADTLLKLFLTMMKEISKKSFVACPYSATLNNIVLKNFINDNNGKRSRPNPYKDKSLCHAIVMLLLINNFKLEVDSLCQCIKLTPTTAITKAKVTGASVVTTGDKKIIQLKLPLNTKTTFRRKSAKF